MSDIDTGDLAEVPEGQRLDHDEDDPLSGSSAIEGGLDDDLADVYADPGEVVEEDLA